MPVPPTNLSELIDQAVHRNVNTHWWQSLFGYALLGTLSLISIVVITYLKNKANQLATMHDLKAIIEQKTEEAGASTAGKIEETTRRLDEVLEQVRRTTETAETIKTDLSQGAFVGQSDLNYRKQQMAEFYGPIYAYVKVQERIYDLWISKPGAPGKLQLINEEVKALFRAQNNEIIRLIATKAHLVEEAEMPAIFTDFVTSVTLWNFYTAKVGYYPDEVADELRRQKLDRAYYGFRDYITRSTEQLKWDIDALHRKYKIKGAEETRDTHQTDDPISM